MQIGICRHAEAFAVRRGMENMGHFCGKWAKALHDTGQQIIPLLADFQALQPPHPTQWIFQRPDKKKRHSPVDVQVTRRSCTQSCAEIESLFGKSTHVSDEGRTQKTRTLVGVGRSALADGVAPGRTDCSTDTGGRPRCARRPSTRRARCHCADSSPPLPPPSLGLGSASALAPENLFSSSQMDYDTRTPKDYSTFKTHRIFLNQADISLHVSFCLYFSK